MKEHLVQPDEWMVPVRECQSQTTIALLIASVFQGGAAVKTPQNSSKSIIAVYFLVHFYCHFLNWASVGHGIFGKNRNNQVQNRHSTVGDFLQKKNHNLYQLTKTFSCWSRGSASKCFSSILIREVIFCDLSEHLFKGSRASTYFQAFTKPYDTLSNLTSFNPVIIRDSPEGTKYLCFTYTLHSPFR